MTLKDPLVIATIRGLLTALGQGALTALTTYQVAGTAGDALVVGAIAFLVALGIRGGVEGAWDQRKGPRAEAIDWPSVPRWEPDQVQGRQESQEQGVCVDCGGDVPGPFMYCPAGSLGSPCHVAPMLDPIPPVDFDRPYHRDVRDGTPHPGQNSTGCQWCLAVKPVTP